MDFYTPEWCLFEKGRSHATILKRNTKDFPQQCVRFCMQQLKLSRGLQIKAACCGAAAHSLAPMSCSCALVNNGQKTQYMEKNEKKNTSNLSRLLHTQGQEWTTLLRPISVNSLILSCKHSSTSAGFFQCQRAAGSTLSSLSQYKSELTLKPSIKTYWPENT